MASPAAVSWHLGDAGYFRLLMGPGEPRALAGYFVGEMPRTGQAAGLVFAVPGLSAPPATGPLGCSALGCSGHIPSFHDAGVLDGRWPAK